MNQIETESELVDVNGNRVFWNLEEEITRVVETSVAVAKTVDGKAELNISESEVKMVDVQGNRVVWTMDEEITRVIETGVALGFDFRGKEDVIREELRRRELEEK